MKSVFLIFIAGMLVACSCLIFWGAGKIDRAWTSSSWPQAVGTIRESRMEQSSGVHGSTSFSPIITYDYAVDGYNYQSSQIDVGLFWSRDSTRAVTDAHPLRSHCPVYFSPENHADSLLWVGLHPRSFQALVLGTIFISFGLGFGSLAYYAPKYGKKEADGSYFFDASSPVTKLGLMGIVIIGGLFILLGYLC